MINRDKYKYKLEQMELKIKENHKAIDNFTDLSKRSTDFLEGLVEYLRDSEDVYKFQNALNNQTYLDKKILSQLSDVGDELSSEHKRLNLELENFSKHNKICKEGIK